MQSLEDAVLSIVRRATADRPVSRMDLLNMLWAGGQLLGISTTHADRKARDAIQRLRTEHPEGGRIVSTSRSAGYYWARTPGTGSWPDH